MFFLGFETLFFVRGFGDETEFEPFNFPLLSIEKQINRFFPRLPEAKESLFAIKEKLQNILQIMASISYQESQLKKYIKMQQNQKKSD